MSRETNSPAFCTRDSSFACGTHQPAQEKAEELEAFTSEAEGKAGASTKARRKQREKLEKDKLDIALQETEEAGIDREQV